MKDETVKAVRTAVHAVILTAVFMPVLLSELSVNTASGIGASLIAGSTLIARIHAIPAVSAAMKKHLKIPE